MSITIVDQVYTCLCGATETIRAIDSVPKHQHYCDQCYSKEDIDGEIYAHTVGVRTQAWKDMVLIKRESLLKKRHDGWVDHLKTQGEGLSPPDPPAVFTCDDCPDAIDCRFAFDDYNTDGDCLAAK